MGPANAVDVEQLHHVTLWSDESIRDLHRDEVVSQTSELTLTLTAKMASGVITLKHDRLRDRWELEGPIRDSGTGAPTAAAVDAFATAVASRPATRPATADDVAADHALAASGSATPQMSPEALRVTIWLRVNWLPKMSDRWLQPHRSSLDEMYNELQRDPGSVFPPGWFDADASVLPFLAYPSTPGVSTQSEIREPKAVAFAVGWWGIVWCVGVPFAVRGQRVRVVAQQNGAAEAAPPRVR